MFVVLNLPFGLTTGYITAVLPLQLQSAGVSIASIASVVAFALSPKIWKFIWAPIADLSLTLKAWYAIGAFFAAAMLVTASVTPVSEDRLWPITVAAFLAEVGTSFLTIALAGLIAQAVPNRQIGRASGSYQLGAKLAKGFAAGAGVWILAQTRAPFVAGTTLAAICILCVFGLALLRPIATSHGASIAHRFNEYVRDLLALAKNPASRFVLFAAVVPIGIAGVSNFWSGVGAEWHASASLIALMIGPMEAVAAIMGCVSAGWLADHLDRRIVFLGSGLSLCAIELVLSIAPKLPLPFVAGTFFVTLSLAMADSALTALMLTVCGVRGAATKYSILAGLGNIPDIYMTSLSGEVHDAWGIRAMLQVEATLSLVCVLLAALYAFAQAKRGLAAQFVAG